jgi:hypothetical protein
MSANVPPHPLEALELLGAGHPAASDPQAPCLHRTYGNHTISPTAFVNSFPSCQLLPLASRYFSLLTANIIISR